MDRVAWFAFLCGGALAIVHFLMQANTHICLIVGFLCSCVLHALTRVEIEGAHIKMLDLYLKHAHESRDLQLRRIAFCADNTFLVAGQRGVHHRNNLATKLPNHVLLNVWHEVLLHWRARKVVGITTNYLPTLREQVKQVLPAEILSAGPISRRCRPSVSSKLQIWFPNTC
jgi:hypothetical protein